jgi:hypothetical protein
MRLRSWLIVIALGTGLYVVVSRRHHESQPQHAETTLAPRAAGTPDTSPRAAKEQAALVAIADDMQLDDRERGELLRAQSEFQSARLALFADLEARRVNAEQVSTKLHALRHELNARIEATLGHDRGLELEARIRDLHRVGGGS